MAEHLLPQTNTSIKAGTPQDRVPFVWALTFKTRQIKPFLIRWTATHCTVPSQERRSSESQDLGSLDVCMRLHTEAFINFLYHLHWLLLSFLSPQ